MNDEDSEWEDDEPVGEDKSSDESESSEEDAVLHEQNESRLPRDNI